MGKKIVELLLCLLHPIAVVLIWYQRAFKREDWVFTRLAWAVAVIFPAGTVRLRADGKRLLHLGRRRAWRSTSDVTGERGDRA